MRINELCAALGVPARQVRYLVAEGALPPAGGKGQSNDAYGDEHLRIGRECVRLMEAGVPVSGLRRAMDADARSVVFRDARFELRSRGPIGTMGEEDVRALLDGLEDALRVAVGASRGDSAKEEEEACL